MATLPTPVQQIINNGEFLDDPAAEAVFTSFNKARINFSNLWNMVQSQGYEKFFLSLEGIDITANEMVYIAAAIDRGKRVGGIYGTPYYVQPAGREPLFYTITPTGQGGIGLGTGSFEFRFYRVHKKGQVFGGNGGVLVESSDISPAGSYKVGEQATNPDLYIVLGDIGTLSVWQAFNLGKPAPNLGAPWHVSGITLVTATQNGVQRTWSFVGNQRLGIDTGNWGGSDITNPNYLAAQEQDFDLLSNQPVIPENEFYFHDYDDIDELFIRQAEQKLFDLILVRDAIDDDNILFAEDEVRRQAMYKLKSSTKTGSIADYILLACPYMREEGITPQPLQKVITANYTLTPEDDGYTIFLSEPGLGDTFDSITFDPISYAYPKGFSVTIINIYINLLDIAPEVVFLGGGSFGSGWSFVFNELIDLSGAFFLNYSKRVKITRVEDQDILYIETNDIPAPTYPCEYQYPHVVYYDDLESAWVLKKGAAPNALIVLPPFETFYTIRLFYSDTTTEDVTLSTMNPKETLLKDMTEIVVENAMFLQGSEVYLGGSAVEETYIFRLDTPVDRISSSLIMGQPIFSYLQLNIHTTCQL